MTRIIESEEYEEGHKKMKKARRQIIRQRRKPQDKYQKTKKAIRQIIRKRMQPKLIIRQRRIFI